MIIPDTLVTRLVMARSVMVLTGAGISAESGIPTFRDIQSGLWSRYDPHVLATPEGFAANPKIVWEWYEWRRHLVAKAVPNAGHLALAKMQDRFPNYTLVTQNVDGLHERAGSREVIELHGNIMRTKCFIEKTLVTEWKSGGAVPPRCPCCGGWLRPDVVWFGEALPATALAQAELAAVSCEIFLSVGTSSLVHPAAGLADQAKAAGAVLIEVNPEETPLTELVDYYLRGKAGDVLPSLVTAMDAKDT